MEDLNLSGSVAGVLLGFALTVFAMTFTLRTVWGKGEAHWAVRAMLVLGAVVGLTPLILVVSFNGTTGGWVLAVLGLFLLATSWSAAMVAYDVRANSVKQSDLPVVAAVPRASGAEVSVRPSFAMVLVAFALVALRSSRR